jgi:hypothetical protein
MIGSLYVAMSPRTAGQLWRLWLNRDPIRGVAGNRLDDVFDRHDKRYQVPRSEFGEFS